MDEIRHEESKFKPTSEHLKTALLSYFRFRRQMLAGDEVKSGADWETCDVMVIDKNGYSSDIEVKISKGDLWQGEAKKQKHTIYKSSSLDQAAKTVNYFYICVPSLLMEEAKLWVKEINPRYGIIEFLTSKYPPYGRGWEKMVAIRKQAKILHDKINPKWSHILLRRLSSARAMEFQSRMKT